VPHPLATAQNEEVGDFVEAIVEVVDDDGSGRGWKTVR